MTHWLQKAAELLESDDSDLKKLAQKAGANPTFFYRGANLEGVNISGQDLRGMEFTDLSKAAVLFDRATRLDSRHMRELQQNPNAVRVMSSELFGSNPSRRLLATADKRIREIASESNSAERTSKLLSTFLDDYRVGVLVIENYPDDQSVTVHRALGLMEHQLRNEESRDPASLQLFVALTVDALLRRAFVYNRAPLLIALASNLSRFSTVRELLIRKITQSHSELIVEVRPKLLARLRRVRKA
jgi:hypothetical protein